MPVKVDDFSGMIVGVDYVDIKENRSVATENTDLSVYGELNTSPGFSKIFSSGKTGSILSMHQVKKHYVAPELDVGFNLPFVFGLADYDYDGVSGNPSTIEYEDSFDPMWETMFDSSDLNIWGNQQGIPLNLPLDVYYCKENNKIYVLTQYSYSFGEWGSDPSTFTTFVKPFDSQFYPEANIFPEFEDSYHFIGICYDYSSGFIYLCATFSSSKNIILRIKEDGSEYDYFLTIEGNPTTSYRIDDFYYDSATGFFYCIERDYGFMKTKWDGVDLARYKIHAGDTIGYGIDYYPATGRVALAERHGNSSPFQYTVAMLDIEGNVDAQFSFPNGTTMGGIAIVKDMVEIPARRVIISNSATDILYNVRDQRGDYGSTGSGVGQFDSPGKLFWDDSGNRLYITDQQNHRIVRMRHGIIS